MLAHLRRDAAHERKLRLFACACCRCVWPLLASEERGRRAVEAAEQYADGLIDRRTLTAVGKAAIPDFWAARFEHQPRLFRAAETARACAYVNPWLAAVRAMSVSRPLGVTQERQVTLIRDLFGNPFRPVRVAAGWITPDVIALAHGVYGEHSFDRAPILADALEEAGCTNTDLLDHLRGPGPHVRGCWAVDALRSAR
jgi:hypothetical protein